MNILDWFKNKNEQQTDNVSTSDPKKKFKISDWFTSTPTELDENGNSIPTSGAKAVSDPYKVAIPLLLSYMAIKSPESGVPMLSGYLGGRQQRLEQQKENAWKQWQVKANQKRQALEDERYKTEHPTYTVPTAGNVSSNNAVDYGQMFTANPQSLNFNLGGSYKPTDKFQNQINNIGQLSDQNNPNMWVAGGAKPQGMSEEGTVDLLDRPQVKNKDGSVSTVRSMSFDEDGKEILVPTVSWDGKILSDKEAIEQYRKTGQHLGVFDSVDAANNYAEQLHNSQADLYVNKKATIPFLNFNQQMQPKNSPSLLLNTPEQQTQAGSPYAGLEGKTISLEQKRQLEKVYQEQQDKAKAEQEKTGVRQSKTDMINGWLKGLPEGSRYKTQFETAAKNPDLFDMDELAKIYYSETSPKAQFNYSGLTFSQSNPYSTLIANNPNGVTQDIVDKAVKWENDNKNGDIELKKLGLDLQGKQLDLQGKQLELKIKGAELSKIWAQVDKYNHEGQGKSLTKEQQEINKRWFDQLLSKAGSFKSPADFQAMMRRNSSEIAQRVGFNSYSSAMQNLDPKNNPGIWQAKKVVDPKTDTTKTIYTGINFKPNQSNPVTGMFGHYQGATKPQPVKPTQPSKPAANQPQPKSQPNPQTKGNKIGGKSVTPMVANEIRKAMKGKPTDVTAVAKKYKFKENDLYVWYKNNK